MKKFWLLLLSLGLIMAFSASAFAVDVKVSGEYYAAGLYLNKTSIMSEGWGSDYDSPSTAFYFQRLRVGTDFIVSPCLKLVTRFDAMERIWGGARSYPGYGGASPHENSGLDSTSAGTRAENENIAFDLVYIDYTAPVGQFRVGYQKESTWGTIFGNNGEATPTGQIRYDGTFGAFSVVAMIAKMTDFSYSAVTDEDQTDHDSDSYRVGGIYKFKNDKVNGEAGVLLIYGRDATHKHEGSSSYMTRAYTINPYFKSAIGPVALQGEAFYTFGDSKDYDDELNPGSPDKKIDAWRVFLDASAKFGIANVGGSFAWLSGDDPGTDDKAEGYSTSGLDWNPCLIMFNNNILGYWVGPIEGFGGVDASVIDRPMSNAWFFQGRVGVSPTPQWDVLLSLSYAQADKSPLTNGGKTFTGKTYGTEIDLTATYKITNNLSYMLGAGYLFAGDYFKGCDDPEKQFKINDDFILINKLTLTF